MRGRNDLRFGFSLVFWREVGWLRRRPLLLVMTTLIPLMVMAVLTFLFNEGNKSFEKWRKTCAMESLKRGMV